MDEDRGGRRRDRYRVQIVHLDEIRMPRRPDVQPSPTDRELFVDPLPEEEMLSTCLDAFGDVEEVFRIPDPKTGQPSNRGYVRFRDHAAASRAVEAEFGTWSESERTLTSQRSKRQDGIMSTYPDSMIARIVGARGEAIRRLQEECGANWMHLRGEDLGHSEHRAESRRVHFIAEGDERSLQKMFEVIERRIAEIHDGIRERIEQDKKDRDAGSGANGDTWRPPGAGGGGGGGFGGSMSASASAWRPPGMGSEPPRSGNAGEAWKPPSADGGGRAAWAPPAMQHPPPGMPWHPPGQGMPPPPFNPALGAPPGMMGPPGMPPGHGPPPGGHMGPPPPGMHGWRPPPMPGAPPGWGPYGPPPMGPGGAPPHGMPPPPHMGGADPNGGDRSRRRSRDRRRRSCSGSSSRSRGRRRRRRD
eukprot:TRINITY_DN18531_c0_g2_i1.p1 TRINITY_DN18531_c0_g2~~TRINITY_DN18531_c0_g2_i1.p1  ORF type:complete len:443 (-),score=69.17 TRINITY_DN18531_c0_g2_i1:282-1529(-)